jgi:hypothetical protein
VATQLSMRDDCGSIQLSASYHGFGLADDAYS